MRELTNSEMKNCIGAACSALPADCKGMGVIILFTTDIPTKGIWINRISNVSKKIADGVLELWMKNLDNRKTFGTPGQN